LADEIEREAQSALGGKEPLGSEAILAQDPHSHPKQPKKSPAPRFHAFSKEMRRALYDAYSEFVGAFRDGSKKLRSGDLSAQRQAT
jgi:hypothetical protein